YASSVVPRRHVGDVCLACVVPGRRISYLHSRRKLTMDANAHQFQLGEVPPNQTKLTLLLDIERPGLDFNHLVFARLTFADRWAEEWSTDAQLPSLAVGPGAGRSEP